MVRLGTRLKIIADNIIKGETMADIGSDHGFLPLYLCENGICPKVIVSDLSVASLQKAKNAFSTYEGNSYVSFRIGNGLAVLSGGEVDDVVIAGMGGETIIGILDDDVLKTTSFNKYIFQPRSGAGRLRYWLQNAGFTTLTEGLAREGKFICEIITAKPPVFIPQTPVIREFSDEIKYELPRSLTSGMTEIFAQFISKKLDIEKKIISSMTGSETADFSKIKLVKSRIEFLEGVLKEVEKNDEA